MVCWDPLCWFGLVWAGIFNPSPSPTPCWNIQYECINLVPSADVADFPGATLRDLAWPNHTAAYLEERRAEQRWRNAKDGSAATHN